MKPTLAQAVHQQLIATIVDALKDDPTAASALAEACEIVDERLARMRPESQA